MTQACRGSDDTVEAIGDGCVLCHARNLRLHT
jgi:hypothetical protein